MFSSSETVKKKVILFHTKILKGNIAENKLICIWKLHYEWKAKMSAARLNSSLANKKTVWNANKGKKANRCISLRNM